MGEMRDTENSCVNWPFTRAGGESGLTQMLAEFDLLEALGMAPDPEPIDAFEPVIVLVPCGCDDGCSRCNWTTEIDETDYSDADLGDEGDDE